MTKAREIAELGQKLTVDGSGNLDIAGDITTQGFKVADGTSGQIDIWGDAYNIQGGSNFGDMRFNAPRFRFYEDSSRTFELSGGNAYFFGATVFNEDGGDYDFRVESDNKTHAIFLDAANNKVGFNLTSGSVGASDTSLLFRMPQSAGKAVFVHDAGDGGVVIAGSGSASQAALMFGNNWTQDNGTGYTEEYRIVMDGQYDALQFKFNNNTQTAMNLSSGGHVTTYAGLTVNEDGGNADTRIESDTDTHALFVDASTSRVGINSSAPAGGYDLTLGDLGLNVNNNNAVSHITGTRGYSVNTGGANTTFRVATLDGIGSKVIVRVVGSIGYGDPWGGTYTIMAGQGNAGDEFGVNTFYEGHENQSSSFHATNYSVKAYTDRHDADTYDLWLELGHYARVDIFVEEIAGTTLRFDNYSSNGTSIPATAVATNNQSNQTNLAEKHKFLTLNSALNARNNAAEFTQAEAVFNNDGTTQDFRVESDSKTHALHVDAGNNIVRMDANQFVSGTYTGSFNGGWQNVVNLDSVPGVGSQRGMKIRVHANENGRTNTSYGEWIAVSGNSTDVLVKLGQATNGNTHGHAQLQMSGHTLQIKNAATSSIGSWAVYFEIMQGA